jgi:hypothetical protein
MIAFSDYTEKWIRSIKFAFRNCEMGVGYPGSLTWWVQRLERSQSRLILVNLIGNRVLDYERHMVK